MELVYLIWLYLSKETELLTKLAHLCEVVKLRTQLECKRKDVANENFALHGLLLILAISCAGCPKKFC